MDETGLWRLFFATGLPEAYLAVQGDRAERREEAGPPAKTAFQPRETRIQQI